MKRSKYTAIVLVLIISNCSNLFESEIDYSSTYLPLNEGNIWYYDYPDPETNYWNNRKISDSYLKNGKIYYRWTAGKNTNFNYDIRADKNGNILLLKGDTEYLWFDFSQDSGSTYIFRKATQFGDNAYNYNVHVSANRTVEVNAGIFDSCIVFLFDVPQIKDEEIFYAFAPDVGVIYIVWDGWSSMALTKALIDGSQVGIWE